MPSTGQICTRTGTYEANCGNRHRHHFDVGDTFTPCVPCGNQSVLWMWIHP